MKLSFCAQMTLVNALLSGCMLKPVTVSTRQFALSPISTSEPRAADLVGTERLSIGIGFVKMPSYLLRDSLAIRNGPNEIEYLENAAWTEHLNELFQRDVAANLADLLPSDSIYLTDWGRNQVSVTAFISIEQFDVDVNGHGTLIAQWRLSAPDSDVPLKSGRSRLQRTGASPRGKPEVIAAILSDLAAQFSRDLAQSIRESSKPQP